MPPQDAFMSVRGRKRRSIPAFSAAEYKRSMPEEADSIYYYERTNGASSKGGGGGGSGRTSRP